MSEPSSRRRGPPPWLFWLLIAVPAAVVVARLLTTGRWLGGGGDLDALYLPYWRYLGQSLRQGRLPLWDPDMGLGIPFAASPQSQTFYPPAMLIFAALPFDPAVLFFCLCHLVWLALGVERLARRMGWERPASICAGALAAAAPFVFSSIIRPNSLCAEAWLPWMLLGAAQACEGRRSGTVWLALCVAMGIGGASPETVLLGMVGVAVLAAIREGAGQRGAVLRCLLGLGLGVGLMAVAWVPFCEFLVNSNRAEEVAGMQTAWSLRTGDVLNLVLPFLKGPALPRLMQDFFFGPFQYDFASVYFGVSLLVLALAGASRNPRRSWLLGTVVVLSILLGMYGGQLGAALQQIGFLPFGWRYPVKFFAPASIALALIGAAGAGALAEGEHRRLARWLAALGGLLTLAGVLFFFRRLRPMVPLSLGWDGCALLLLAAALRWAPAGGWRLWALTAVCLADVEVACLPFPLASDLDGCPKVAAAAKARAGGGRVDALLGWPPEQGLADCLSGNILSEYGVSLVGYYGTPNPAGSFNPTKGALLNVTLVLRSHPEERGGTVPLEAPELAPLFVATVPDASPRVELRPAARVVAQADLEHELEQDSLPRARTEVLLEGPSPPASAAGEAYEGEDLAKLDPASPPERLEIETASSGERYLVLADRDYPGWTASVDGQPLEILRAYGLLRALRLGPGRHHVRFEFRPVSLHFGLAVSLLSALLLAATTVRRGRRKGGGEPAADSSGPSVGATMPP